MKPGKYHSCPWHILRVIVRVLHFYRSELIVIFTAQTANHPSSKLSFPSIQKDTGESLRYRFTSHPCETVQSASAFHLPDRGIVDWFCGWRILRSHTLSCFCSSFTGFVSTIFKKMNPLPSHSSVPHFCRQDKGFFRPLGRFLILFCYFFPPSHTCCLSPCVQR